MSQGGRREDGAGPYTAGREAMDHVSDLSSSVGGAASGGAMPMIEPIEAIIWVRMAGETDSA